MNLYNGRNKIIKLFEDKNILPSKYPHTAKSEPNEYDEVQEPEQKFDESIGERVKLRRQKEDDKKDERDNDDEQLNTTDMLDLESEESAEQRRKTKGYGLKILTPQQILSRLPISLAQLKARKNSENLTNEIK